MPTQELIDLTARARRRLNVDGIPGELKAIPQWVCWQYEERRNGKPKLPKVPIDAVTGGFAKANDPSTWRSFADAVNMFTANERIAGIGFEFANGVMGVDLDHCLKDGAMTETGAGVIAALKSFTEISPSGDGIHIYVRAELPPGGNRKGDIEFYSAGRFFTVTGDAFEHSVPTVRACQDDLDRVHAGIFKPKPAQQDAGHGDAANPGNGLADEELLAKASTARNGEKFKALWAGDWAGYPSQSEADFALMGSLRFWTNHDRERAYRMFRTSGLGQRDKADRDDYLDRMWDSLSNEPGYTGRPPREDRCQAGPVVVPGDDSSELKAEFWKLSQTRGITKAEELRGMSSLTRRFMHRRGRFFYHLDHNEFAETMYFDARRKLLLKLHDDEFQSWLSDYVGVNRIDKAYRYIFADLENEACTGETTGLRPQAYWASRPGAVYLSNGDGHAVKITAAGFELCDNGTDDVLFAKGRTLMPWRICEPKDPFETCRLFRECSSPENGRELLRIYLLSMPTNQRCKPPIVNAGPVGGGKTRLARGVFEVYGMPSRIVKVEENGEDDFWTQLDAGGIVCFDNVDTRIRWLADAIAAASTDGIHEKRKLYTDGVVIQQRARAWIILTSCNPTFAADTGLADRLLVTRMERRNTETAESALSKEVEQNRDAALSWICKTLSKAMADTAPVAKDLNRRHPDFADFAQRLGRALGREDEVVRALKSAEADKSRFNLENDDLGAGLLDLMATRTDGFVGTAGAIREMLADLGTGFDTEYWTAKRIGKRIEKLWPHIESVFQAHREKDSHTRLTEYRFAYCAYSPRLFSENPHVREKAGENTESPLETTQTTQTGAQPPPSTPYPPNPSNLDPKYKDWDDAFDLWMDGDGPDPGPCPYSRGEAGFGTGTPAAVVNATASDAAPAARSACVFADDWSQDPFDDCVDAGD